MQPHALTVCFLPETLPEHIRSDIRPYTRQGGLSKMSPEIPIMKHTKHFIHSIIYSEDIVCVSICNLKKLPVPCPQPICLVMVNFLPDSYNQQLRVLATLCRFVRVMFS